MILLLVFTALFMVFFGMSVVFIAYICVMWSMALQQQQQNRAANANNKGPSGLTAEELERLGGAQDGAGLAGVECAVCLDDIEGGQAARVLPECKHAFHRDCADAWLAVHSECPLCRADLSPRPTPPLESPLGSGAAGESVEVVVVGS